MPSNVRVLDINPGSDGDGRKWPKHHYIRNDGYFLERIATDKWIKDRPGGPEPGVTYKLNKMPNGYAGFEKTRSDGAHIDRYIYGHPNGQFRSLNEFYPHFKHLMDYGGPVGCTCKLCTGSGPRKPGSSALDGSSRFDSEASRSPPRQSKYILEQPQQQGEDPPVPQEQLISPFTKRRGRPPKDKTGADSSKRNKLVDFEGATDIYESMIARLKAAEPETMVDLPIEERMSPDWRMGNTTSKAQLQEWRKLPRFVPRCGELVLFVRKLKEVESIRWDKRAQIFRRVDRVDRTWGDRPVWEVGVVTQMPAEEVLEQDLVTDEFKEQAVTNSGFRIEPFLEPGVERKSYPNHKYIPAHAIRPFTLLQECLNGLPEKDWHPSIKHAATVARSFCVISRYRFKGTWPNATVFSRGVFIGSELIMVSDTVRLVPRKGEKHDNVVTDVMVVTAIRLRFVNLDLEDEDESPESLDVPYQTCLHISGRVYTLDPTKSFDGVGKVPITSDSGILPPGLEGYGQWYHYSDPDEPDVRIELPYTRILGRAFEDTAMTAWFNTGTDMPPPSSLQAVDARPVIIKDDESEISRGLQTMIEARTYSQQNDKRIKSQEGKTWFWADTRIEQLDLHEVNGRYVGAKHALRTPEHMGKWRTALKMLDGKKGGLEAYHAARRERQQQELAKRESSGYGMVNSSMQAMETDAVDDEEGEEDGDIIDVDRTAETGLGSSSAMEEDEEDEMQPLQNTPKKIEAISLHDEDEDDDEPATNQLVGELVKNMRKGEAGGR